jgi:hypothetical protein
MGRVERQRAADHGEDSGSIHCCACDKSGGLPAILWLSTALHAVYAMLILALTRSVMRRVDNTEVC